LTLFALSSVKRNKPERVDCVCLAVSPSVAGGETDAVAVPNAGAEAESENGCIGPTFVWTVAAVAVVDDDETVDEAAGQSTWCGSASGAKRINTMCCWVWYGSAWLVAEGVEDVMQTNG
jgi:hypothetical protein